MNTGDAAGGYEMMEDTVGLDHEVLTVTDFYFASEQRIDKGQFGQSSVEQIRQGLDDLAEGRLLDKHTMEDTVGRIGIGVLLDAAAGVRTVSDIHREEQIVDHGLSVHGKAHMLGLMLYDSGYESE